MRVTYLADGSTVAGEGLNVDADQAVVVWLGEQETRQITIDWSELLSSVTTSTAAATNATVFTSAAGTTQTLTLSAPRGSSGTVTVTASDGGETHERQMVLHERQKRNRRDYADYARY